MLRARLMITVGLQCMSFHSRKDWLDPGLARVSNDSDDALWQELKQEWFTTPMLRGWLPYVRKELELKSATERHARTGGVPGSRKTAGYPGDPGHRPGYTQQG
jgi:hypothetical protein